MKCSRFMEVVQIRASVLMLPNVLLSEGSYHFAASIFAAWSLCASSRAGARSVSRDARVTTS